MCCIETLRQKIIIQERNTSIKMSSSFNITTLDFLDLYEKYQNLWNPSSPGYKNKHERNKAYKELISEINEGVIPVDAIKRKIKCIRTTYGKELRSVREAKRMGIPYKPKLFWYSKADSFLHDVTMAKDNACDDSKTANTCEATILNETSLPQAAGDIKPGTQQQIVTPTLSYNNDSTISGSQHHHSDDHQSNCSEFITIYKQDECSNVQQIIERCAIGRRNGDTDDLDEFGKCLAAQLRCITDTYSRSVAKLKIQQVIFEAESGSYRANPVITVPIPTLNVNGEQNSTA